MKTMVVVVKMLVMVVVRMAMMMLVVVAVMVVEVVAVLRDSRAQLASTSVQKS